ncbi:hypothetical protein PC9H_008295 [Pleurotus ostreatus]|uniref:Uncharacterized protein n=1 Tax=Pleurotus ostreatus TaxID=5322 RepID=A0A8H6ZNI3_PLEOS|nr:uncharacterized protein PC9H_008295 [Pleurotus ostreatus]KAF7425933.1 hypothetical protein PC9H_008295 [Pleurotus ostreatus]
MSTSASHAETGRFTYEGRAALSPTLEEQHARAASSSPSTTVSTPESEQECRALEAGFLVDLHDDSDPSPSTSADSLGEQSGPPSTTAATTPDSHTSPPECSFALSPLALNDDLAPAVLEPVAQFPSAVDVESSATAAPGAGQALPASPRTTAINAQVLHALLQLMGSSAADTTGAFNLGYPTATTTPGSASPPRSPAPIPRAVSAELVPAVPEAVAQYQPALDVDSGATTATTPDAEHALSAPPSDVINAQALRALLQASANAAEQAVPTHNYGYPVPTQQDAYFPDASFPPAHGFPLLDQSQYHLGTLQGYPAPPFAPYPQPGVPLPSYYGPQVPQQYQHGYYNPYAPNGLGLVFAGTPPPYAVQGFPMQYQSEGPVPVPHLSAKPLSATGRPNEPAGPPQGQAAEATSSKRKRPVPDWKGKGKAKTVEENVDADATSAVDGERADDDGAPPAKKPRRAARGSKDATGQPQTTRKNRSYTLLPNGMYKCSHCGDDTIKNKNKHRQMCGLEGPLLCPLCGLELVSRRNDSLKRHLKSNDCKNSPSAVAAASAAAASAGTELTSTYHDGENDAGAEEDDGNDEHDEYQNVAGPSSVTLEDIPKPKKKATKKKAAKKN